jgi:RNA polymerase-associated protein
MKLYQIPKCPFAHRARIVLGEKKLAYSTVYFESKTRPRELASVSPDARSPTIFDEANDTWVWDSSVVAEYLDERYPDAPLLPKDPSDRARTRLLMREADSKIGAAGGALVEEFVHKAPEARDPAKPVQVLPRLHQALELWDSRLAAQPFFAGAEFTLADIVVYTPLCSIAGLVSWERAIPARLKHLSAWRERVGARPSTPYA